VVVSKVADPVFHATAAEASNFSGQSTIWVSVINKCVAQSQKVTEFLQKLEVQNPFLLFSTLYNIRFLETR
jgi:hypothetical protein